MKKTQKTAFGLLGLIVVFVATFFAAQLPSPEATAVTSVTDTIQVRVVGSDPMVNITSPNDGKQVVYPDQSFDVEYANVNSVSVKLSYNQGELEEIYSVPADYEYDKISYPINFEEYFGYGQYLIEATGHNDVSGLDANPVTIYFEYVPVTATISQHDLDNPLIVLDYDENGPVDHVTIIVTKKEDGSTGTFEISRAELNKNPIELYFAQNGLEYGTYDIKIIAKDKEGNVLYDGHPFIIQNFIYKTIHTPETGALFNKLNISRTDYLLTGLMIFFAFAVVAIVFIMKNHAKKGRKVKAHAKRRR